MSWQIPASKFARRSEELLRKASPPFLVNHSLRCFHWAVALAERDEVRFDAELLYVAATLHDLGLTPEFDSGRCFEDDSAEAAMRLAARWRWPRDRCDGLGRAIRLHMAEEVEPGDGPEACLLWQAAALDVSGYRFGDLSAETVQAVMAGGLAERIAEAPFAS